jgi:hypothetical protein
MFGPGGSLTYTGIEGVIYVAMGSGNDTVFRQAEHRIHAICTETTPPAPRATRERFDVNRDQSEPQPLHAGQRLHQLQRRAGIAYTSFEAVTYDVVAPVATDITFDPTVGSQSFAFTFNNADVAASLSNASLALANNTTFTTIASSNIAYSFVGNVATFTFPGLGGTLPDGDYTATLIGATDPAGNDATGDLDYRVLWSGDRGVADVWRVKFTGFYVQVRYGFDASLLVYQADPLLLDMIAIYGGVNDDVLNLDMSGGNPIPPDGIHFAGGSGDTDRIRVLGRSAFADAATFNSSTVIANGRTVTLNNVEAREFQGAGGDDLLTVNGGTVELTTTEHLGTFSIASGAVVTLVYGGPKVLVTKDLAIAPGGWLDLDTNDLIVNYPAAAPQSPIGSWNGSAYTGLTGQVASGRHIFSGISAGVSDGHTTMLGIAESADALHLGPADMGTFSGEPVDATAVLIKFTYGGDATLDGKVNVDDYGRIDFNVGLATRGWYNGDFNLDGKINVDDYGIIDFNVGIQGPPLVVVANATASATTFKPPDRRRARRGNRRAAQGINRPVAITARFSPGFRCKLPLQPSQSCGTLDSALSHVCAREERERAACPSPSNRSKRWNRAVFSPQTSSFPNSSPATTTRSRPRRAITRTGSRFTTPATQTRI